MGNRYNNFKWIYIKSKNLIKIYAYHNKREQDRFVRWSYSDLDDTSTEITYKQALGLAVNKLSKVDIARVDLTKRQDLFNIFKKYNIPDTQIISI